MRNICLHILFLFVVACNDQEAPNCLKSSGDLATEVIELQAFNDLLINNEFEVVITEGPIQEVKLTVGKNIFNDIEFTSDGSLLEISNTITCKWVRDYNYPTLEITHPDISSIEIIGGSIIRSSGTLSYQNITFRSKSSNGIFDLNLNSDNVSIDNNEITNYTIIGSANTLNLVYSSGNGRFEGAEFVVDNAIVTHIGSNDIIINVREELSGTLGSTGDLIYVGEPPAIIDVTSDNRGQLIDGTN